MKRILLIGVITIGIQAEALEIARYNSQDEANKASQIIKKIFDKNSLKVGTVVVEKNGKYEVKTDREVSSAEKRKIERALEKAMNLSKSGKVTKTEKSTKTAHKKRSLVSKAVTLYKSGNYSKAYELFKKYEKRTLSNPNTAFLYGLSAYESSRYDEALRIYNEMIKRGYGSTRVKLEHARTLIKLGNYEGAKSDFSEVLGSASLPRRVRENVESYLSMLDKRTKKNIFAGSLSIGVGYDDNIYNHTYLGTTEYNGEEFENNSTRVSDSFHTETAMVRHLYIFDNRKFAWDTTVQIYNRTYRDHSDVNTFHGSIISGPKYFDGKKSAYIPLIYNRLWYGNDDYMSVFGTRPQISYIIDETSTTDIKMLYIAKRYKQGEDEDRDGDLFGVKFGYNKIFKNGHYLRGEAGAYGERRKRGDRKDISFNMYTAGVKYSLPVWDKTHLYTYGTFEYYDYLKNDPNMNEREDKRIQIDLDLSRQVTKDISVEAKYSFTKNISTINLYEFKKNVASINLLATF